MPLLLWTPFSINYLVQLIIGLLIIGYLAAQVIRDVRHKRLSVSNIALLLAVTGLSGFLGLSFLRTTLHPDLADYTLPWIAPVAIFAMLSILVFAYTYPAKLILLKSIEGVIISGLGIGLLLLEICVAISRVVIQNSGFIEFRDNALDTGQIGLVFWIIAVFWRQYLRAQKQAANNEITLSQQVSRFFFDRKLPHDAAAARAFLLITLTPVCAVIAVALQSFQVTGSVVSEIALCWLMLSVLGGFTLIYLNYIPERSSFMVKLVGVTLTVMLVILASMSWIIGETYTKAYRSTALPESGTAIRFQPDGSNGYLVNKTAFRFDDDIGERVLLPYTAELDLPFPFYGVERQELHLHSGGIITFDHNPSMRHLSDRFGGHAAILPLMFAVEFFGPEPSSNTVPEGLYLNQKPDRTLITWHEAHSVGQFEDVYTYQVALYPNGVIEFIYKTIPENISPDVFRINATPMYSGITPGWLAGPTARIHLASDLPYAAPAYTGVMADYRLDFLKYLNRIYEPVAIFTLFITLTILICVPLFFQNNLVVPLNQLLTGVRQFRAGEDAPPVAVAYKDEIGFLTEAFNDLTEAQKDLVRTLEQRVEERTQSALSLAEENARLAERNHLSSELHDAVSQTLFSATLIADTLSDLWERDRASAMLALERMRELNRGALAEMRLLLLELRPGRLADHKFGTLLRELGGSVASANSFNVELEIDHDQHLPSPVQITFYRIAQESLNNITKHAQAQTVKLYFDALPNQCMMSISDDGKGFDLKDVPVGHMGLQIMRDRVQKIGGHLEISTAPNRGTTLTVIWYAGGNDE